MNLKHTISGLAALLCLAASARAQIQAGRAIQITISGVPAEEKARFDLIYPVSDAGTINMPFIGPVRAAGLRAEQLATSLEAAYRAAKFYTHPTFQVIDSSARKVEEQMVFVGGQVRHTGSVPFNKGLTVYQAIQNAGGATEFGSMKRVKLLRAGKQKQYDLSDLKYMQIPLEPGDTIEVPQKTIWNQ